MQLQAGLTDALDALVLPRPAGRLRVGLIVPQHGALGMLAPSVIDAALLAAHEANAAGGVRDARIDLVLIDGGRAPDVVAGEAAQLATCRAIDVAVSFCASDVHLAVARGLAGRIPCIYTPPHEGSRAGSAVICLGPAPADQLRSAIGWLSSAHRLKRWALIGNDYVWPRAVHRAARTIVAASGAAVVLDEVVPLASVSGKLDRLVDLLARRRADALLVSLIGQDQVSLHRALRESGLDRRIVRLSGALEENGLMAAGGDRSGLLYAAMPFFASMTDEVHLGLMERHAAVLGAQAPVLDAYAEATYQGLGLVAQIAAAGELRADGFARAAARTGRLGASAPTQLARADGLELRVVPDVQG